MSLLDRPVFTLEGVSCNQTDDVPCENVPLRDERIDREFAYCNVVEEVATESPSAELDGFDEW